jgi:ATP-dependent DNA helicase RecQ
MSYVYARRCRRAFLLDYFGDPAAGESCSGCDVCRERGAAVPLDADEYLIVRKVLATVARLDSRFGRNRVALVLEGSTGKEVLDAALDKLATYGLLRGRSHSWVLDLLGALEAAGLITASRDEYPTLRITPAGREVMHARQPALVALPSERTGRSRGAPGARAREGAGAGARAGAAAASASRTAARAAGRPRARAGAARPGGPDAGVGGRGVVVDVDDAVFQRLRGLRARLAAEAHLPAYCVAHDRTLAELARAQPRTLDALAQIPGIGPGKLARYGQAFLQAIAEA